MLKRYFLLSFLCDDCLYSPNLPSADLRANSSPQVDLKGRFSYLSEDLVFKLLKKGSNPLAK